MQTEPEPTPPTRPTTPSRPHVAVNAWSAGTAARRFREQQVLRPALHGAQR
jgi:hypothetical protein